MYSVFQNMVRKCEVNSSKRVRIYIWSRVTNHPSFPRTRFSQDTGLAVLKTDVPQQMRLLSPSIEMTKCRLYTQLSKPLPSWILGIGTVQGHEPLYIKQHIKHSVFSISNTWLAWMVQLYVSQCLCKKHLQDQEQFPTLHWANRKPKNLGN